MKTRLSSFLRNICRFETSVKTRRQDGSRRQPAGALSFGCFETSPGLDEIVCPACKKKGCHIVIYSGAGERGMNDSFDNVIKREPSAAPYRDRELTFRIL